MNFATIAFRAAAALALLGPFVAQAQAPQAFQAGNFVVVRLRDGTADAPGDARAVFLLEYTLAGTLVQTLALPTADAGPQRALTETNNSTTDGSLTRSADGRYLVLAGYNAQPGTAALSSLPSATVNRLIGRIDANGHIDTSTRISDAFSGGNIRGAASADGTAFYAVGSTSGVVYAPLGNAGPTTALLPQPLLSLRTIGVAAGRVYVATAAASQPGSTYGLQQVGTGLPTTSGQSLTPLPGFPLNGGLSPYAFFFADLSPAVPGPDVAYIATDQTGPSGGIEKWSLANGTWVRNGNVPVSGGNALYGVAGALSGGAVRAMASGIGALYTFTDQAGYNAPPSAAGLTLLATPGRNQGFRGVALAPQVTPLAVRTAVADAWAPYPNPVQNVLTVDVPVGTAAGQQATVRDLQGRVVVRQTHLSTDGRLSLLGLPTGTYLLTLDGHLTRRISKE